MKNILCISDNNFFDINLIKNIEKRSELKFNLVLLSHETNLKDFDYTPNKAKIWRYYLYEFDHSKIIINQNIRKQFYRAEKIFYKMLDFIQSRGNEFTEAEKEKEFINALKFCLYLINNYKPECLFVTNFPHNYFVTLLTNVCEIKNIPLIVLRETLPKVFVFENTTFNNNKLTILNGHQKLNQSIEDFKNYKIKKNLFVKFRNHLITQGILFNTPLKFLNIFNFFVYRAYFFIKITIKTFIKFTLFSLNNALNLKVKFNFQNPMDLDDRWKKRNVSMKNSTNSEFYVNNELLYHDFKKFFMFSFYKKFSVQLYDKNEKFVYFPLHYQPEATTYPYGQDFINQIEALKLLRNELDPDIKIYVKEHPDTFNLSRHSWYRGSFARSKSFYEEILKIKNTNLVKINENREKLISNSLFVASITGTSCLESVIRNKQAIIFGNAWFSECEGITQCNNKTSLKYFLDNKIYLNRINQKKIDEFFNKLNNSSFNTSKSGLQCDDNFTEISDYFIKYLKQHFLSK